MVMIIIDPPKPFNPPIFLHSNHFTFLILHLLPFLPHSATTTITLPTPSTLNQTMRLKYGVDKYNMPPEGFTFPKFINKQTQNKHDNLIKHRNFHLELGFSLNNNEPLYGLPIKLASTIDKHNWKTFVNHSGNPYASIVREFYSCILERKQNFVLVRGVRVCFTPKTLNFHFNLIKDLKCNDNDVVDEYQCLKNTVSDEKLNSIMKTLTVRGTNWKTEKGKNVWKIPFLALKAIPKVWYRLICTKLLPNSNFQSVDKDRLLLLYCVVEGFSINVGKIIYDEIIACAFKKKKKERLLFPSLISDLCVRNGVRVEDDDEVVINREAIGLCDLERFFEDEDMDSKREGFVGTEEEHFVGTEEERFVGTEEERFVGTEKEQFVGGDEAFVRSVIFQHMQQTKEFWGFFKEVFNYERKMFELNFEKKVMNPPKFPDEILQPFMTDPMHEKGKNQDTGEPGLNSFVQGGDDEDSEEKEGSDKEMSDVEYDWSPSSPPPPQSPTKANTKTKTTPNVSVMRNKKKRSSVDINTNDSKHDGNGNEEDVIGVEEAQPVGKVLSNSDDCNAIA
ncbi:uncharacterized protein [Cicer arietinum]|uniref:Uncharacterized protein LOC101493401 isoform X2 n=1 Tax=Cicer arietinum TaxID=3827 RepID=A0A1S2Z472_CICAR|nr:uncharacterized protein LOC101493401 isoform X2 [Cicer arietinum]